MKLNNLDLNKLKSVAAVAKGGSLLLGAKQLGLTPSAVHQSLAKLEEGLGITLFHRTGKVYILTEAGKEILSIYERLEKELEFFEEKRNPDAEYLQGVIRVALPLFYSKSIFLPLMKTFNIRYPNIHFHLTIQDTEKSLNDIVNFKVDFAIVDESKFTEFDKRVNRLPIYNEELTLACSKDFYKKNHSNFENINLQKKLVHLGYSTSSFFVENWYKQNYKKKLAIENYHVIN